MGDTDTDGHVCEVCEERFDSEAALRRHVHDAGLVD